VQKKNLCSQEKSARKRAFGLSWTELFERVDGDVEGSLAIRGSDGVAGNAYRVSFDLSHCSCPAFKATSLAYGTASTLPTLPANSTHGNAEIEQRQHQHKEDLLSQALDEVRRLAESLGRNQRSTTTLRNTARSKLEEILADIVSARRASESLSSSNNRA
ncbi:hypothetical protein A4X03_0g8197, partial [Tilletia caries]